MRNSNVKTLLFLSILVMLVLPMVAAFYFLDRVLQTSLDLGFNAQVVRVLEKESHNLKTLRNVDPGHQDQYREEFNQVEELRHVYANPTLVKKNLRGSLTIYFGLGLVAALLASVLLATFLSQRIARAYRATFSELSRQNERVRYLEEISSWQELAKMLAHEIKNPLTPIEVLVTSLSKAYLSKPQSEFHTQLQQTEIMIAEELTHLKNVVNRFSEFAKLPAVHLIRHNVVEVSVLHVNAIVAMFTSASIQVEDTSTAAAVRAEIDVTLFRQVLTNIIRNGVEANPGCAVQFRLRFSADAATLKLRITNDGAPIPAALTDRIFDPYVSSKSGKDNMGLGLAIVRKILIEHGGDITYAEFAGHPAFTLTLPRIS